MNAHTLGPWLAREMVSGNWQIADDATGHTIAHIRDETSARLVAAAPALLEAAMAALDYYAQNENDDAPTAIELRAAIAQAQGR